MAGRYVEAGDGWDWIEDPEPYVPKAEGAPVIIPNLNVAAPSSIPVNLAANGAYQNLLASSGETGMTAQEAQGFLAPEVKNLGNGMIAQYSPVTGELTGVVDTAKQNGSYDLTGTFRPNQNYGWSLGGFLSGGLSGLEDLATSDVVKTIAPMALSAGLGGATGVGELFGLSGTTGALAGGAALGAGTAALTGGDIGKGLLTGAIGGAGADLSGSIAESLGVSGTLGSVLGGAGTGALTSLAQGNDFTSGLVSGGLRGLAQGLSKPEQMTVPLEGPPLPPGFDQYLAADSGITVPTEIASLPSSFDQYLAADSGITVPTQQDMLADTSQFIDSISQYQEPFIDTTVDTGPAFQQITVPTEVPVDYSLTGIGPARLEEMGNAQGIQAPVINEPVTVANTPIDYSLSTSIPFEGLQMPTVPNLESMGGGQGLSVSVPGGTVAEGGFVPTGTLPALGDSNSFINNPTAIEEAIAATPPPGMSQEQFTAILRGLTGLFGTGLLSSAPQPAQQQPRAFVAPTQGIPTYSPAYFQQIQQGYNQLLPNQPRDVATPLQNWYNTPYSGKPDSVTAKLFGVI